MASAANTTQNSGSVTASGEVVGLNGSKARRTGTRLATARAISTIATGTSTRVATRRRIAAALSRCRR